MSRKSNKHQIGIIEELENLQYRLPSNIRDKRIYWQEVLTELNKI